jgi:cell division septal protein FtsQ
MSDRDLERVLREALAAEARPMSEEQVRQVCERAVARRRAVGFPWWVIAASAACLAGLGLLALSPWPDAAVRMMASVALAGNLALSPLAALVLVRSRRHGHAS